MRRAAWLRVERGPITIVCNFATEPRVVPTPGRAGVVYLASKEGWQQAGDAMSLPGETLVVFGPAWERESPEVEQRAASAAAL